MAGLLRDMFPDPNKHIPLEWEGDRDADYDDVDPYAARESYRRSGRTFKIAIAAGFVTLAGIGLGLAYTARPHQKSSASAEAFPDNNPTSGPIVAPTESATTAPPTPTHSKSPTPSATTTPPRTAPTETHSPTSIPSPTHPRRVILAPTPTHSASPTERAANCIQNPNAGPGEIICASEVQTFTDYTGNTPSFTINGPARVNCDDQGNGRVQVSINNAVGFMPLVELEDGICN